MRTNFAKNAPAIKIYTCQLLKKLVEPFDSWLQAVGVKEVVFKDLQREGRDDTLATKVSDDNLAHGYLTDCKS